jgi:hypothetical protein
MHRTHGSHPDREVIEPSVAAAGCGVRMLHY